MNDNNHNDIDDDNLKLQRYQSYLSSRLDERLCSCKNDISTVNKKVNKIICSLYDLSMYDNNDKEKFFSFDIDSDSSCDSRNKKYQQTNNGKKLRHDVEDDNDDAITAQNNKLFMMHKQEKNTNRKNNNFIKPYKSCDDDHNDDHVKSQHQASANFQNNNECYNYKSSSSSSYLTKLSNVASRISQKQNLSKK